MSKEEYYSKIKRFVYKRFNELEVIERSNVNYLYLRYNNNKYAEIAINKKTNNVYYDHKFRGKICKTISLENTDFEILLCKWVEDTFQMKVNAISKLIYTVLTIP